MDPYTIGEAAMENMTVRWLRDSTVVVVPKEIREAMRVLASQVGMEPCDFGSLIISIYALGKS